MQKPSLRCSTDCSAVSPSCTPRNLPHFNPSSRRQLYTVLMDNPICSQAALTSISSTSFSTSALYSALYFCPISCPSFLPLGVRFYYITPKLATSSRSSGVISHHSRSFNLITQCIAFARVSFSSGMSLQ